MPRKPPKSPKHREPLKGGRKPSKKKIEAAKKAIEERLKETSSKLSYDSKVRVHEYADGSIDGELSIQIPRGKQTKSILLELEKSFGRKSIVSKEKGYWISIGERHTIKKDEEIYRKLQGMNDVQVYYQKAKPSKISINFLAARTMLSPGMEKKYRRKADTVYVRLHWNVHDRNPRR